eukprot:3787192-Lingulodinium_polyedra.AAC.1
MGSFVELLLEAAEGRDLTGRVLDAFVVNGPADWRSEQNYILESFKAFWERRPLLVGPMVFPSDGGNQ